MELLREWLVPETSDTMSCQGVTGCSITQFSCRRGNKRGAAGYRAVAVVATYFEYIIRITREGDRVYDERTDDHLV